MEVTMQQLARSTAQILGLGPLSPGGAVERLERALARRASRADVHNAALRVDAPSRGVSGSWAVGHAAPGIAMTTDTPFLSASVGKLFTAATALSLAQRGALQLDAPVARYLPPGTLDALPLEGDPNLITLRSILAHRSGLPDYFDGKTRDRAPNVRALVVAEPERRWSREALLGYTSAHFAPLGRPGQVFGYADTNYDLLGLVIEAVTGSPWHQAVRREVIDPLGLTATWYHDLEVAPAGVPALASAWIGRHQVTGTAAISVDQAGGGLATTLTDLARFARALDAGHPVPRATFEDFTADAITRGIDYGLGMWRIRPVRLTWGLARLPDMLGVSGVTGSFVYLVPDLGAVVAGTFNQTNLSQGAIRFLVGDVLGTLSRVGEV